MICRISRQMSVSGAPDPENGKPQLRTPCEGRKVGDGAPRLLRVEPPTGPGAVRGPVQGGTKRAAFRFPNELGLLKAERDPIWLRIRKREVKKHLPAAAPPCIQELHLDPRLGHQIWSIRSDGKPPFTDHGGRFFQWDRFPLNPQKGVLTPAAQIAGRRHTGPGQAYRNDCRQVPVSS